MKKITKKDLGRLFGVDHTSEVFLAGKVQVLSQIVNSFISSSFVKWYAMPIPEKYYLDE